MRYSVHFGAQGGTEYREWTGEHTYRVVSKYKAWPYLEQPERDKAEAMELARREAKQRKADDTITWRQLRGGR